MGPATIDPLASAQLTDGERRTVERFAAHLRDALGIHLRALWLDGPRARGEAIPNPTLTYW